MEGSGSGKAPRIGLCPRGFFEGGAADGGGGVSVVW